MQSNFNYYTDSYMLSVHYRGTQFGMLIAHLQDKLQASEVATTALSDLEDFYRQAKIRFDDEAGFADRARVYVVKLQGGDAACATLWQQFIDVSIQHSDDVYKKLNVNLKHEHIMGESDNATKDEKPTAADMAMANSVKSLPRSPSKNIIGKKYRILFSYKYPPHYFYKA